ncbi:MAG TPA: peptidyl-prolyl cis-trans isomerase [Thermoanaerobaculia bacterium]|jgi:peptidyl-prolyl cis-trans isomerase D|nr:peptidyl-prolyl cis-trans isomerase [Thermoanaerobaculia bacterium]
MLKVFRDNLKHLKWILVFVVLLFIFFIWADFGTGIGNRGRGAGGPQVAAYVGDGEVTLTEFERQYRQLEGMYGQIYGDRMTPEMARQMGLPMQALNQAVSQEILLAEARDMGLEVTDAELRDNILQEQTFKDEQGRFIGEERYQDMVRNRLGYASPAVFEQSLREELLVRKLMDILKANLYVSDKEVEEAYRSQVERARIRYIQLPRSRFTQNVQVTDAEIKDYFAKHAQEYRLPEQREAAYLLVDPAQLAAKVPADEAAQRAWYQEHQEEYTQPEQVHARHILVKTEGRTDADAQKILAGARARLAKGEDFAALARELSEEPAAKTSGGDLGFFGRGQMVPAFEEAAFGAQPNALVGPIKSDFGWHLIQVLEKRPAGTQPFAQVQPMIAQRLSADRTSEMAEAKARELAQRLAKDKPASADALKPMANAAEGISFGETGPFSRQEPVNGIGFAPAFNSAAFTLQKGGASEAIQTPRGWAVLYVKDVKAPRAPEIKDVEPRVRAAVGSKKQQDLAQQQLRQAKAPGATLDKIAAGLGLEIKESAEFGRDGQIAGIGQNPELAKAAMALSPGQLGGPVNDAQGAVLFEVKERKSWDPIQFASAREQTREQVSRTKLDALEAALLEKRRRELDVRFDPAVLEEFGITEPPANPAG